MAFSISNASVIKARVGRPLLVAIVVAGFVSGCATLDKSECETGDWRSIGLQDGTLGKVSGTRLAAHSKACGKHGVRLDSDLYMSGYTEGLQAYCTADIGFEAGSKFSHNTFSNANEYKGVCPSDLELTYLEGYLAGLKINLDQLHSELKEEEAELDGQRGAFLVLKALNSSRADGAEESMQESDQTVSELKSSVTAIIKEVEKWLTAHPELREQMN